LDEDFKGGGVGHIDLHVWNKKRQPYTSDRPTKEKLDDGLLPP